MEMYKLAIFIVIINFAFGWIAALGIVSTRYDNYMEDHINETLLTESLEASTGDSTTFVESVFESTQYMAGAVGLLFQMLYYTTMGLPQMLSSEPFEFPPYIVNTIIAFQVIIYGIGIAQFLRGFSLK